MAKQSNRNWQLRRIHTLTKALGMDRETYVEMLVEGWSVSSSKDLDDKQRSTLIGQLTEQAVQAGVWHERVPHKVERASHQAIKKLRFHSIACAVYRAPLHSFVMEDGTVREGPALRRYLVERFNAVREQPQREGVAQIPSSMLRYLSETFINPLCNRWLSEKFERQRGNDSTCYFHELNYKEVQYLTTRWKQFHQVIEAEDPNVDVPFITEVPTGQEN